MIAGKDDEGERRGVNRLRERGIAHPNPLRERGITHLKPLCERGMAHLNPLRERGIIAEIAAALIPH